MPYEFSENEFELEPAAASGRSSKPPRKYAGVGVVDPPGPPTHPLDAIPAASASLSWRIVGAVILVGLVAGILFLLFAKP